MNNYPEKPSFRKYEIRLFYPYTADITDATNTVSSLEIFPHSAKKSQMSPWWQIPGQRASRFRGATLQLWLGPMPSLAALEGKRAARRESF